MQIAISPTLPSVDTIYLGTGFHLRYEYLERGGILQRRPNEMLKPIEAETWPGIVSTDYYRERYPTDIAHSESALTLSFPTLLTALTTQSALPLCTPSHLPKTMAQPRFSGSGS